MGFPPRGEEFPSMSLVGPEKRVAVNSAHVHCLLGKNATDNLRMLQMMQCNLCETILSIKGKCFCDGDPAKKVVLKEGK